MRLAAMQPYFFPYLGYFQLIAAADQFLLYDNLNYIRQGWVHRNRIRLKGGGEFYCAAPLLGASSNVRIRDVRVDPAGRWPGRFLDLLEHNYKKAPFYDEVFPAIEQAVRRPATHLTEVNQNGILAVADSLSAMMQERPYKAAMNFSHAESEIHAQSGRMYDPLVVDAFRKARPHILSWMDESRAMPCLRAG